MLEPYLRPLIFLPSILILLPLMVCSFSESRERNPCDLHEANHDAGNSLSGLPDLHTSLGAGPMFSLVPMISCSFIKIFMPGQRVIRSRQRVIKGHDGAHDGLTRGSRQALTTALTTERSWSEKGGPDFLVDFFFGDRSGLLCRGLYLDTRCCHG